MGDYDIDRFSGKISLTTDGQQVLGQDAAGNNIPLTLSSTFFFGVPMLNASGGLLPIGTNTPPTLTNGTLNPIQGTRTSLYVYTVTYTDVDGPNGQAPAYVRVYIDGIAYDMSPVVSGTPAYKSGAVYTYTAVNAPIGGSHKYHFEASDGAASAIFDEYNILGQQRPGSGVVIWDIDGPWVNNPPTLTNGADSPDTGLTAADPIDFTVTYGDLDNNPPYFYAPTDTTGQAVSGSPRLWVDSTNDTQTFGLVHMPLLQDPLEQGKYRIISATNTDGSATNWTDNEFAGQLMQITTGPAVGTVYLIQSNTSNELTIATEDLSNDKLDSTSQFVINGLLMPQLDPTQVDFTSGIVFKLTVPRLPVGTHRYHFTARSRETMPSWLITYLTGQGQTVYPYSAEVRDPVSGDHTGPTVANVPPAGAVPPVLADTQASSLYWGPFVAKATATAATTVGASSDATLLASIEQVLGVYLNPGLAGVNYFDTAKGTVTATQITLTSVSSAGLPTIPAGTVLVQQGAPYVDPSTNLQMLFKVVPDAASAINSVGGVYTSLDTAGNPTGTIITPAARLPMA